VTGVLGMGPLEIARAIAAGELSSEAVVAAHLARIESVNPLIHAVVRTDAGRLTGQPVVVVPWTTSPEGLPIAVQIVGRGWEDHVPLAAAAALERSRGPWTQASLRAVSV